MDNEKDLKEEISAMLDIGVPKETPATEAPPSDDKDTSPATDAPVDDHATEPPKDDEDEGEDKTAPPATSAPVDELAATKAEIASLKQKLDELLKTKEKETPTTDAPDLRFVDEDVDIDDVTRDPNELNKLLNKVYRASGKALGESVLSNVSKNVPELVNAAYAIASATDRFYQANPELKAHKQQVAKVFDELRNAHKDWDTEKLLTEIGTETKKRLNISARPTERSDRRTDKPHLPPGSKGGKRSSEKPKVNPLVDEIDKMNAIR